MSPEFTLPLIRVKRVNLDKPISIRRQ